MFISHIRNVYQPGTVGSQIIAVKPKATDRIRMAAILLFYNHKTVNLTQLTYSSSFTSMHLIYGAGSSKNYN
jgi:hypothetical protein